MFQTLLFLAIAFCGAWGIGAFKKIISKRDCSFKNLARPFRQRLSMTIGIGVSVLFLFAIVNFLIFKYFDRSAFMQAFEYGVAHPIKTLYFFLFLFIANAFLLLIIRLFLKYLFIIRRL